MRLHVSTSETVAKRKLALSAVEAIVEVEMKVSKGSSKGSNRSLQAYELLAHTLEAGVWSLEPTTSRVEPYKRETL